MDYNTFRSGGGYNARGTPPPPAPTKESTETAELIEELDGREGQFSELPITGGVGPFHINHFIGYGEFMTLSKPAEVVAPKAARFYREFLELFMPNDATADQGKYDFKGADTIEFSIGGKKFDLLEQIGGFFHSDWVSIKKSEDGESFYNTTLRRRWLLFKEDAALAGIEALSDKAAAALLEYIRVNQHHFLAGRRSFRFGYDESLHRVYVETAAFERSSLCEYHLLEKTGLLRDAIIAIWTNLITNVQQSFGGLWLPPPMVVSEKVRAGYQTKKNVDYRAGSFATAEEALSQKWFAKVLARNPGLLKGLPF